MPAADLKLWRLIVPAGLVAELAHDPSRDDMPWHGVRIRRGPEWETVASDLSRELQLVDAGAWDDWEQRWRGLRERGLRLLLPDDADGEYFALHVDDGDRGRLRFLEQPESH